MRDAFTIPDFYRLLRVLMHVALDFHLNFCAPPAVTGRILLSLTSLR
jgi:hypothetical protein